jgi:hypothetical protein
MADNQWRWVGPDGFEYTGNQETLAARLRDGGLPPTIMVARVGSDVWQPASEVAALVTKPFAPVEAEVAPLPAFHIEDESPTVRDNPLPEPPLADQLPAPADPPTVKLPALPRTPPPLEAEPPTSRVRPVAARSSSVALVAGVVALVAFALGGVTVLVLVKRTATGSAASASASASAAAPVASASGAPIVEPAGCSVERAQLVSRPVFPKVPLEVASAGGGRVAVAFARTEKEAQALVLSADTLDKHQSRRQPKTDEVAGARPLVRGDTVELVVDAEEKNLRGARSLLGERPLRIGAAPRGIARSAGDGEPEVVWPLNEAELTPMRIESRPTVGHFVAFRAGGQAGRVLAGWLGPDGGKKTELIAPELQATALGTPSAALGSDQTLLLVAAKSSAASEWQVAGGSARPGQVPKKLAPIALGDAATARMSPSAVALPGGRWLLQWTERGEREHMVKLQPLDDTLTPAGPVLRASPQGGDSGQGQIWFEGSSGVSFFLVSAGGGHELWAAPVRCR